jgi:V-type H+-transporting ATPase subunit C
VFDVTLIFRALSNDWNVGYEKLTDMIVPRSSQLITQDQDFGLFNVTLFKKVVEEFKLHAREKKFVVREFTYNEEELAAGKNEITKLVTDKKKQFVRIFQNACCPKQIFIKTNALKIIRVHL